MMLVGNDSRMHDVVFDIIRQKINRPPHPQLSYLVLFVAVSHNYDFVVDIELMQKR